MKCKIGTCSRSRLEPGGALGYCAKHYKQHHRNKTPDTTQPRFAQSYDVSFKVETDLAERVKEDAQRKEMSWSAWWRKAAERFLLGE